MGVHGLWTLLSPAAHATNLQHLYHKRLAVDVSIWLHQFSAGIRPPREYTNVNFVQNGYDGENLGGFDISSSLSSSTQTIAHDDIDDDDISLHRQYLIAMFHRLCKLLHHGIRPVFVFDGQTPLIKRNTVRRRARDRRKGSGKIIQRAAKKMLRQQLAMMQQREKQEKMQHTLLEASDNKSDSVSFRLPRSHLKESLVASSTSSAPSDAPVSAVADVASDVNGDDEVLVEEVEDLDMMGGFFMDGDGTEDDDEGEWRIDSGSNGINGERGGSLQAVPGIPVPELHTSAQRPSTGQFDRLLQSVQRQQARQGKIDPEVFAALPQDIRDQIIEDVRTAKSQRRYASTASVEQLSQQTPGDFSSNQLKHFLANRSARRSIEDIIISNYEPKLTQSVSDADNDIDEDNIVLSMSGQLASDPDTLFAVVQRRDESDLPISSAGVSTTKSVSAHIDVLDDDDDEEDEFVTVSKRDELDTGQISNFASYSLHQEEDRLDSMSLDGDEGETKSVELTIDASMFSHENNSLDDIFTKDMFEPLNPIRSPEPVRKRASATVIDLDDDSQSDESPTQGIHDNESTTTEADSTLSDDELLFRRCEEIIMDEQESNGRTEPQKKKKGKRKATVVLDQEDNHGSKHWSEEYERDREVSGLTAPPIDRNNEEMIKFLENESNTIDFSSPQPKRRKKLARFSSQTMSTVSSNAILSQQLESQRQNIEQYEEEMNSFLASEAAVFESSRGTDTEQLVRDVKEMLNHFGVPYLEAPYEADSQCGYLNMHDLVDGVITEDSDVFLFGASCVYKYLFSSKTTPEEYDMQEISTLLGLDRCKMVALAMLLGSDYTDGVYNVGIVTAMEIVDAFRVESEDIKAEREVENVMTVLNAFAEWVREIEAPSYSGSNMSRLEQFKFKHHKAKQNFILPEGFPSRTVAEAYLSATNIDRSLEPFAWGTIDTESIFGFALDKMKWSRNAVERYLRPILEHIRHRNGQQREIGDWVKRKKSSKVAVIRSKRILAAVDGLTSTKNEQPQLEGSSSVNSTPVKKTKRSKRKGRS